MSRFGRRRFLGAAAAGAAGIMAGRWLFAQQERRRVQIALQLYSIRGEAEKDLAGVLEAVAKMGYEGVEFAGYYGHSADELRKLLDDNGLKCAGAHVGLDTLRGDEFDRSVEFHQAIGNKYPIVPGLPGEYRSSRDAWRKAAELFNELAEKLKPHGMRTGYHNHSIEFQPLEGELPWDTFFGNTVQDVIMQFDTGNAMHAGAEAPSFLERYPHRAISVHCKEYSKTNDKTLLGEGDVPWDRIFEICETTGDTEWYVVEQESYAYPPLECVEKCLQNLKAMGK